MRNFKRQLLEAIQVEGANFIGNGKGYDLFDVITWNAASQFVIEETNDNAGQAYVHDQNTFERNINENQHLYFFARENTNKVFGAVVKSNTSRGSIQFTNQLNNQNIQINTNFMFENAARNSNECPTRNSLPLYLIPNASFDGVLDINGEECYYIVNHELKAAIGALTENSTIDVLEHIPDFITKIDNYAFGYGVNINSIELPNDIQLEEHSLDDVNNIRTSLIDDSEFPYSWSSALKNKNVILGYGLNDEQIAQLSQERAERLRQERERAEREERIKRENDKKLNTHLRYKIVGKEIYITGGRPGDSRLEIPAEIEGKPVTRIVSNAFSFSNLRTVKLPTSLKVIEKFAFAYSDQLCCTVNIPKDCIVGKDAFLGTRVDIYRI